MPSHILVTFFWLHNLFHFCLLTVLWFWFKPSHCLPVTMWIYLSQRWNRANTSSFFVILESLNALSTFYVYFLFSFGYLTCLFVLFVHFWKKNPAEGRVLSCEIWMKKRCRGVFNLSCLTVWLTFYDRALCTCLFLEGKSTLNMLQRNYIQSVIHCILCYSSDVWSYLRICHVQKRRMICKYMIV